MKNTGVCPKCGRSSVIRIEGQAKAYGAGNNIPMGMTIFTYIPVDRYLCINCGFSEEWIEQEHLQKLADKYR